jgi:hypothetical protein
MATPTMYYLTYDYKYHNSNSSLMFFLDSYRIDPIGEAYIPCSIVGDILGPCSFAWLAGELSWVELEDFLFRLTLRLPTTWLFASGHLMLAETAYDERPQYKRQLTSAKFDDTWCVGTTMALGVTNRNTGLFL